MLELKGTLEVIWLSFKTCVFFSVVEYIYSTKSLQKPNKKKGRKEGIRNEESAINKEINRINRWAGHKAQKTKEGRLSGGIGTELINSLVPRKLVLF